MNDSQITQSKKKGSEILYFAKSLFGLCFILGSICFFGQLLTKAVEFAVGGYMLLIFGTFFNILVILGLLIYGWVYKPRLNECLKAIGILLINIPIAVLYAVIGVNNLQ
ncbi:hypothetical protein ACP3T3_17710 [Chryseobacterium sp. CBSDS_008]|uniref:hypothetical protein n=1 Tax=Chryseobacterium sp. CBSDS_008 TaxID=3415265 RepID=UPI003CF2D59C